MDATITPIKTNKRAVCIDMLHALPEWFGLPHAVEDHARHADALPMFGCVVDGAVVGFLSLKIHTPAAAEAYVLGVKKPWQRQEAGRRLFAAAEASCRQVGLKLSHRQDVGGLPSRSVLYAHPRVLCRHRIPAARSLPDVVDRQQSLPVDDQGTWLATRTLRAADFLPNRLALSKPISVVASGGRLANSWPSLRRDSRGAQRQG